jgi:hypothetical protein
LRPRSEGIEESSRSDLVADEYGAASACGWLEWS